MEDTKKTALEESCPEQEKLIEDLMAQICELKLNIRDQTATIESQTATIEDQNSTIKDQNTTIAIQKATIEELKQRLYGRKSEHHKRGKKGEPNGAPSNDQFTDSQNPKDIKEETVNRKDYLDTQELPNADPEVPCGHLSSQLRREIVEIESKPSDWTQEGYDELEPRITERLVVEPAKVYVLRTIRRVWKSKETNNIAPLPPPPAHVFDRCSVDESVIVHIILNRFLYHLPYYRQEKMFRLMACPLSRDNMIRWCNDLAFLFAPIVDAIEREVKASRAVYIDETPFLGRITGRRNGKYTQIYFWPLLAKDVGFVFRWSESRNNEIAKEILKGLGPTTSVVCDGLNIYQHCVKELKFNMQLCWAHIRRKFFEALPSNQILADRAMEMIGQIFAQEGKLLKQKLLPEMLLEKRNALVKPELDSFIDWVRSISTDPEVVTSSKLNTACQYLLTRENEARYFLTDPFVLMHNNDNERESKNFKLGAKNWLFVSSPEGANALSIYYSLLRSAQIHGIHPFYYLLDLCKRIEQPGLKAADLTPREWEKRFFEEAVPENYRQEYG